MADDTAPPSIDEAHELAMHELAGVADASDADARKRSLVRSQVALVVVGQRTNQHLSALLDRVGRLEARFAAVESRMIALPAQVLQTIEPTVGAATSALERLAVSEDRRADELAESSLIKARQVAALEAQEQRWTAQAQRFMAPVWKAWPKVVAAAATFAAGWFLSQGG